MPFANPFAMVVMLVLGLCLLGTINNWLRARRAESAADTDAAGLEQELAWLRDRVHVLERLATDGDTNLRNQFRSLD